MQAIGYWLWAAGAGHLSTFLLAVKVAPRRDVEECT